jgi:hypothetical protein
MSYDTKCDQLARAFLVDEKPFPSEETVEELAQAIQDSIEDWLAAWTERGCK